MGGDEEKEKKFFYSIGIILFFAIYWFNWEIHTKIITCLTMTRYLFNYYSNVPSQDMISSKSDTNLFSNDLLCSCFPGMLEYPTSTVQRSRESWQCIRLERLRRLWWWRRWCWWRFKIKRIYLNIDFWYKWNTRETWRSPRKRAPLSTYLLIYF